METRPTIFISYSSTDQAVASSLYNDLTNAGVDVFQFEESATPGQPAWDEVLSKIEASDIFILLASKDAVKSKPVQEEIKFAHYQYLNVNKPSVLLPLVLEPNLQLPKQIRANNIIPFHNYDQGFRQLARFLKIEAVSPTPAKTKQPETTKKPGVTKKPAATVSGNTRASNVAKKPARPRTDAESIRANASKALKKTGDNKQADLKDILSAYDKLPKSKTSNTAWANLFWYILIVVAIGIGGAFVGWLANEYVIKNLYNENLTKAVLSLVAQFSWIPVSTKIILWILVVIKTFNIADDEYPIDKADYAIVAAKSTGITLLFSLLWSLLLNPVAGETFPVILITLAIAVVVVIIYAVLDVST